MIVLGLGAAVLALALPDPGVAVVAATAGGLAGVLVAAPIGAAARAAFVGIRELRALAVAGAAGDPRDGLAGPAARRPRLGAGGLRRWPTSRSPRRSRSGSGRSRSTSGPPASRTPRRASRCRS